MQAALAELERPFSIVNGETKDLTAYEEHGNSITFVQYQACLLYTSSDTNLLLIAPDFARFAPLYILNNRWKYRGFQRL